MNAAICAALGIMLVGIKFGEAFLLRSYKRAKRMLVCCLFLNVLLDLTVVASTLCGIDYVRVGSFIMTVVLYLKTCLLTLFVVGALKFRTYGGKRLWLGMVTTPIALFLIVHVACYVVWTGGDHSMERYAEFLTSAEAKALAYILYIVIAVELCVAIRLTAKAMTDFNNGVEMAVGKTEAAVRGSARLMAWTFMVYSVLAVVALVIPEKMADVAFVWVDAAFFILAVLTVYNMQHAFIKNNKADDDDAERWFFIPPYESVTISQSDRSLPFPVCPESIDTTGITVPGTEIKLFGDYIDQAVAYGRAEREEKVVVPLERNIAEKVTLWMGRDDKPYLCESITIAKVAAQMEVSPRILSDYLNNICKTGFNAWINKLKVEEVKRILVEEPSAIMADIAERVGFTDAPALSKVFKKVTGETPTSYRNKRM